MGERRGAGGAVERSYVYDATNQLRALTERTRLGVLTARYAYDALGRRVSKTVERRPLVAANDGAADARVVASVETREFLWLGNVLLAEGPAGSVLESVYLHEPGSFRPLALVRGGSVYHYHLDHLGTPQEVTNDTGEIVWRARLKAWGGVARTLNAAIAQPIRFQGQYHDAESGLYYNRYRYYAPDEGCYVQQDPIGLAGGINTAAYVGAPTGWVDPFGLTACELRANMEAERNTADKTYTPHHIVPETDKAAAPARSILAKHGIDVNDAENGVYLPNRNNTNANAAGILRNGRHPVVYLDTVSQRITAADQAGEKEAVLSELSNMRGELLSASRASSSKSVLGNAQ